MDYLAIFAVMAAYMIKGLSGFANALVFGSIMSFSKDNIYITPIDVLLAFPSNLIMTIRERKSLSKKIFLPLIAMMLIGVIPGTLLLKNLDSAILKIVFGIAILLISADILLRFRTNQENNHKGSKLVLTVIGVISGVLSGLFGVGAFLVAYINRTTDNASAFRANLCIVFMADNLFRIILYSATGILTLSLLKQALILIPFMVLSLFLGIFLSKKINETAIKIIVAVLLILTGISLIITNVLKLI